MVLKVTGLILLYSVTDRTAYREAMVTAGGRGVERQPGCEDTPGMWGYGGDVGRRLGCGEMAGMLGGGGEAVSRWGGGQ